MQKYNLKDLLSKAESLLSKIEWRKLSKLKGLIPHFKFDRLALCWDKTCVFISSWWHVLLLSLLAFLCLYYPLGGMLINKIDKTTDYEISKAMPLQSTSVEMMNFIINREVNDKIWTPNLPFFFPSYFLDNMPSFQLGMMSAVSTLADAMSKRVDSTIAQDHDGLYLSNAAQLLKYDGQIWMFSPQKVSPVPSANSQYRKARKQLIKYNQDLSSGRMTFYKSPADLSYFLTRINKDLQKSFSALETQIREESSSWIDFKADNVFYYNQGKLYAYYLLLSAMGSDYKNILVQADAYQAWTKVMKALEDGARIDAIYIRNGDLNSMLAPNHLAYLDLYILKVIKYNKDLIAKLNKNMTHEEN